MSVRILPLEDVQVVADFARQCDLLDEDGEAAFIADIVDANRRLFRETYGPVADPSPTESTSSVVRRPAGAAAAAFAVVIYNAGPISAESEGTLARIGQALVVEYVAEKARLQ